MAEQPQGFARRMMAQKLMTDARNTPGSDSPFFAGRIRPSMADIEQPTRFSDMAMPAYSTGATASLFAPGAGVADVFGGAPDPMQPGQMLPSFGENIGQGNYLDAGLQTLGAAGDVALAAGSRGAATADEAAERNYVIFDDKAVKILKKYGIAGPVLVTGAAVAASKANNDNEDGGSILPDAGII